jgi:hypothetical protein
MRKRRNFGESVDTRSQGRVVNASNSVIARPASTVGTSPQDYQMLAIHIADLLASLIKFTKAGLERDMRSIQSILISFRINQVIT